MIITVTVTDDQGVYVFEDAICEVSRFDLKGENGGYPSMAEVARVVARLGYPREIFKDAQAAILASREKAASVSSS